MLRPLSTRLIATQKAQLLSLAQRSILPPSTLAPAYHLTNLSSSSNSLSSISTSVSSPVSLLSTLPPPLQIPAYSLPISPSPNSPVSPQTSSSPSASALPTPKFNFVVAASWNAKHKAIKPKNIDGESKVPYWKRTQVGKVDAGEDAFFHTSTPNGLALGVADGVGGWSEMGVDPALFSWTLMNNAAAIAKDPSPFLKTALPTPPPSPSLSSPIVDDAVEEYKPPSLHAKEILTHAFDALVSSGRVKAGSSTACILDLCTLDGTMTSSNLGDSSFLIIREKKIVYESPSQQHYFNCPYQLSIIPENYPNQTKYIRDSPHDADSRTFQLKGGDIIILATDGFFDNVFSHESLSIVNKEFEDLDPTTEGVETMMRHIRKLSSELTNTARRYSLDPKRVSPWAHLANLNGMRMKGGKVDDITCIVTFVQTVLGS